MALSGNETGIVVAVISAVAAVIGPQQWHVRRSARKKLAEDTMTVLAAKDETIEVQAKEITFLRELLAANSPGKGVDGSAD